MSVNLINESYSWKSSDLLSFLNEGNVPSEWRDFFFRDDVQVELNKISNYLEEEAKNGSTIYPSINRVFRALYTTPIKDVKVVILGMDPYHNGNAVGLCFSVLPGSPINPSLQTIYKELANEGFSPTKNGVLTHLPPQGVLLLNTALTVEKGCAGEHIHIWYEFSRLLIIYISEENPNAIWLLMGANALDFRQYIRRHDGDDNVVVTSHPMPLSAYKGFREHPAFIGSNAFLKINEKLQLQKRKPIMW